MFVAMIQFQLGAAMIMIGTGNASSHPVIRTRFRPHLSARSPYEVCHCFNETEAYDKGGNQHCRFDMKLVRSDQRNDGTLNSDHAPDEGVDQNQQGELLPVLPQTKPDNGFCFGYRHRLSRVCRKASAIRQRFDGSGQTGEHANSLETHSLGIGVYTEDLGVAFIEAERGGEICMWHVSKAHGRYTTRREMRLVVRLSR